MNASPDNPRTHRRVVVTADEQVVLEESPIPTPQAGQALVRTQVSGVCGSDTHAAHNRHPFIELPYHPGHEVVGIVHELGPDSSEFSNRGGFPNSRRFAVGDRVTVEPTLVCRECKQCRQGRENLCEKLDFFGCGNEQGGMGEYFTIGVDRLHHIPADFTEQQAALVEPLSTPVHAVRLASVGAEDLSGKTVVILGSGTIGLLVLAAARHRNAAKIVVTDVLAEKRDLALRFGADAVVDAARSDVADAVRAELGESADVVFDCVAIQSTIDTGVDLARKAGTVVVVGVAAGDVRVPLPILQDQQIRIQGSATYLPEDYREAIEILASGAVRADEMVTGVYELSEAAEAFEASLSGDHIKVLVRGSGPGSA